MLFKRKDAASGKTLYRSKPLLGSGLGGYTRPPTTGNDWFQSTTSVWRVDELIRRRVRDWKRLLGEDGHTGTRAEVMRKDHDSVYTATHSVFPAPLMEMIILRYGGPIGGKILDAFAGGAVRGVVTSLMGHHYHGIEIRKEQIDENLKVLAALGLQRTRYHLDDGRFINIDETGFDAAITCPPYHDLEQYSDQANDLSNMSYEEFNAGMMFSAFSHFEKLKPGAFACIVVGNFRDKSKELVDFRSHTVQNFREAGFIFHQEVILSKNFASAAKRSTNSWRGLKLVPAHEYLLVFRKPHEQTRASENTGDDGPRTG